MSNNSRHLIQFIPPGNRILNPLTCIKMFTWITNNVQNELPTMHCKQWYHQRPHRNLSFYTSRWSNRVSLNCWWPWYDLDVGIHRKGARNCFVTYSALRDYGKVPLLNEWSISIHLGMFITILSPIIWWTTWIALPTYFLADTTKNINPLPFLFLVTMENYPKLLPVFIEVFVIAYISSICRIHLEPAHRTMTMQTKED